MMTHNVMEPWEAYEQVAAELLNRFATDFGLDRVEGKQKLPGLKSSTTWEIDAKGARDSDGAIFIVECRRYPDRKVNQDAMAGFAYRIQDIGAQGGILVSPLEPQSGARSIAKAEEIVEVQLEPNSTPRDFAMRFFGKLMVGASVEFGVALSARFDAEVLRHCEVCGQRFSVVENERRCPDCQEISHS